MAPFLAWLPARSDHDCDVVVKVVGRGVPGLAGEIGTFAGALARRGLEVVTTTRRLNGPNTPAILRLRVASRPIYSSGHGCDVLVYLDEDIPDFRMFGLQPGSVVLWDAPANTRKHVLNPEGVIVYPVPLKVLSLPHGGDDVGRAMVALGALASLLGFSEEGQVKCGEPRGQGCFDAGRQFAVRQLVKRDIYSLPAGQVGSPRVLLTMQQAVNLGLSVGHCDCGTGCRPALASSAMRWAAEHLANADHVVSTSPVGQQPGVQIQRGPERRLMVQLGGRWPNLAECLGEGRDRIILAAADVSDALALLAVAQRLLCRDPAKTVGVFIEGRLMASQQGIRVDALEGLLPPPPTTGGGGASVEPSEAWPCSPEPGDSPAGIPVGYVAWGAAQGVVRDAVNLCRSFGLQVAALYPRTIEPFPTRDLEAFSRSAGRVVVVESDRADGYADRLQRFCSLRPGIVRPEPGRFLTPMDVFLREGLGT